MTLSLDTAAFDFPDVEVPLVWRVLNENRAAALPCPDVCAGRAAEQIVQASGLPRGAQIAVGVGSRGIANLQAMVIGVVQALLKLGMQPFIVPAMGSHGGATAEGQAAILAGYGITAEAVGVPIRATMEVVRAGSLDDGYPIYFDRYAAEAGATLVINRVKHHTDFRGPIESGLCKMCAIGLGKRQGADAIHRFGADGLRSIMPEVGRRLVKSMHVIGGIAIIENEQGETSEVRAVPAEGIGRQAEMDLLDRARSIAPRLPFDDIDVLVVDEMGKDISGSGLDTHVIGRVRMPSIREADWDGPSVRMLAVMDLTDATHGNAAGLGLADIVTRRLIERVDFGVTCTNHRTSQEGGAYRGSIPIIAESPASCVRGAIGLCGRGDRTGIRLVRIRNTEKVQLLEVSAPLLDEVRERASLTVLSGPQALDLNRPMEPAG